MERSATVTAGFFLYLMLSGVVTSANGQTPKPAVAKSTKSNTVRVVESPEHKAFRLRYEGELSKCETLLAKAEAIIDKGTLEHNVAVCAPNPDTEAESVTNELANELAQARASLLITKPCDGCSTEPELQAALDVLKSVSNPLPGLGSTGALYKELENLRTTLTKVDPCVAVYRKTIDKKASDLTVRESEQVQSCRSLDLYPPDK